LFSILNKESLLKCGYNVLTAKSAEESIKLTYNNHFDLILMDIDLGEEIDGIQTAKSILDIRDIPIIFFSSHSSLEILQKVEETSSYGYIPKNSDFQILCMSIKMALKLYEAKKKIIERENHYRYIFDQSYDPIFITQTNHQIVDANLATSELFGYSKEELLGLKITDLVDSEILEKEPPKMKELLANGSIRSIRTMNRKDNTQITVELRAIYRSDDFVQVTARNITEQVQKSKIIELNNEKIFINNRSKKKLPLF
jgi:PAS domain S-box-containing protein